MTFRDLITSDVTTVFLDVDDFAEAMLRFVGGDPANGKSFVGVAGDDVAVPDSDHGRGYTHSRTVEFAATATLSPTDALKIGSLVYQVESITDPVHGMQSAKLVRYEPETKGAKYVRRGGL